MSSNRNHVYSQATLVPSSLTLFPLSPTTLDFSSMHMSIVCSLCVLSLFTGVYCTLTAETEVHITVYAPLSFVRNSSEVYFNRDKEATVKTDRNTFQLRISQYSTSTVVRRILGRTVSRVLKRRCQL